MTDILKLHPKPWTVIRSGVVVDRNGNSVSMEFYGQYRDSDPNPEPNDDDLAAFIVAAVNAYEEPKE